MGKRSKYPGDDAPAWLYLIERATDPGHVGTIKIGMTSHPRARMKGHGANRFGGEVVWRHFCTSGTRGLVREIERAAIHALARAGKQKKRGAEEFQGISRERATLIVRETALHVRQHFAGLPDQRARFLAESRAWHDFKQRLYVATERCGREEQGG